MRVGRVLRVGDCRSFTETGSGDVVVSAARRVSTGVEPGEITITTTVFVDFALIDR